MKTSIARKLIAGVVLAGLTLATGTGDEFLKPKNQEKLKPILLCVEAGEMTSKALVKLHSAETANGQSVAIQVKGSKVMLNNVTVIKADVETRDCIIRMIDSMRQP